MTVERSTHKKLARVMDKGFVLNSARAFWRVVCGLAPVHRGTRSAEGDAHDAFRRIRVGLRNTNVPLVVALKTLLQNMARSARCFGQAF